MQSKEALSNETETHSGILCLVLALALIATAIVGSTLEASDGALGTKYTEATRHEASVSAHTRAAQKLAPSTIKKTEQAVTAVESAVKDTGAALADAARLSEGLAAGEIGDTIIDLLRQSGGRVETDTEALKAALSSVKDESLRSLLSENIDALLAEGQSLGRTADELTLALFSQKVTSALKTLNTAEDRLNAAFTAIAEVYSASDLSREATGCLKDGRNRRGLPRAGAYPAERSGRPRDRASVSGAECPRGSRRGAERSRPRFRFGHADV